MRAVRSLLVALAVRSLCFCLQRSLCAAVAAGASAEVETKEMTTKRTEATKRCDQLERDLKLAMLV